MKIGWRRLASFGLIEQHHEHVRHCFRQRRNLTCSLLIYPFERRQSSGGLVHDFRCFCSMPSCHDSPLHQVLSGRAGWPAMPAGTLGRRRKRRLCCGPNCYRRIVPSASADSARGRFTNDATSSS
ncbi:hypothetical protein ebA96 [Aromatoleum aromaticum EbN1]|uniref:Uncharacterized protein n=1 Tax=Aromatoleum aromaticum (strain DSM 19018 / LMG 30748 / EbN1) TaxID=76114 RepID=Q5P934_AROAE|nr:hypothetical protein ebA96 [Aromatoleum aromaticum EbN1]